MPDGARHCGRVLCRTGDHGRRPQIDRGRSRRRALGTGASLFARLARRIRRRHRDGSGSRAVWRTRNSDFRVADDCCGPVAGTKRRRPEPARRLRGLYRPPRQCRDECAAIHIRVTLVRPAPRHGSGPARQRLVGLGGNLGADLRGSGGANRLAQHDARFCRYRGCADPAHRRAHARPRARSSRCRQQTPPARARPPRCSGYDRRLRYRCLPRRVFAAACQWRCRKAILWLSAPMSGFRHQSARRCSRCCSVSLF